MMGTLFDLLTPDGVDARERDEFPGRPPATTAHATPPTYPTNPDPLPSSDEPRPDLTEDSARWHAVLAAAFLADGEQADGVFGCLHGLRCCGCRIEDAPTGWRLIPGGDYAGDWQRDRETELLPRRAAIARVLRSAQRKE